MQKTLFQNLWHILSLHRARFFLGLFYMVLSNGLLVTTPLVFREAIFAVTKPDQNIFSSAWFWGPLLLFLTILSGFLKYVMRVQFMDISRYGEEEMRKKIFSRIQEQSMTFFDHHPTGDLLSRLTNDIAAYQELLGPGILFPCYFISLAVPSLFALFYLSTKLAFLSLVPFFLFPFVMIVLRSYIVKASKGLQQALADLSTLVHESFSAIRMVKSYGIEKEVEKEFSLKSFSLGILSIRFYTLQGIIFPFMAFLTKVLTIFLVLLAGTILLKNWGTLNAANFLSFMWIQSYLFIPILMLGWVIPIFERGNVAYHRLLELYEEPIEVQGLKESNLRIPKHADIEITNLTFTYPSNQTPTLKNFSLHIKSGTFLGITGPVGAGKSTLFKLLTRQYEIPRGMIAFDGRDIHDYPLDAFTETVVSVEQMPFIFSRTILENVQFGQIEFNQERVEEISKQVDLHETIMDFKEQYKTVVGERGATLSGGQKQRIAIARAFILDRSIVLLDDIFSAIDVETEKKIFKEMKKNLKGKTVLMITPRVTILDQLDRIIYMQDGEMIEDDSPSFLKKQKGPYSALYSLFHDLELDKEEDFL